MIKKIAAITGILLLLGYLLAIRVVIEPVEQRPGTRLSGETVTSQPAAWEGRKQIFVETRTWYFIRHSVTTIAWWRDGTIYVPCGACDSKRWPLNVAADPRVRLKIDGRLFSRNAERITDQVELQRILSRPGSTHPPDGVSLFRMNE